MLLKYILIASIMGAFIGFAVSELLIPIFEYIDSVKQNKLEKMLSELKEILDKIKVIK